MLYMVRKIFRYGISFNIIYNESGHKNMNTFFSQSSGKNILILIRDGNSTVWSYTHIYQVGPFIFRLLVRTQHNW